MLVVGRDDGALRSLDATTGRERWRVEMPLSTTYSGWESRYETLPSYVERSDAGFLALTSNGTYHPANVLMPPLIRARMLDAATGATLWDVGVDMDAAQGVGVTCPLASRRGTSSARPRGGPS